MLKGGGKFICFSTALYLCKMQINQATKTAFTKNDLTYFQKNVLYRPQTDCGEMAEQAEGAPLLREYGVKNSIEGSNPSLTAICLICLAPVAQLDRVLGYEPSGQRFESSRVRHFKSTLSVKMVTKNKTSLRTRSSAGQSTRLRTERSKVRILSGAPSSLFKLSFYQKQLTLYLVIFLDHQQFLINNFRVCL